LGDGIINTLVGDLEIRQGRRLIGRAQGSVAIGDVFRGTIPFFITMLMMMVLLIHFQELALWLPRKAFR
jgi:TRAP-type mannitol/chloroaromatic compound transport system permease large subunit